MHELDVDLTITPMSTSCRVENITQEFIEGDVVFHCTAYDTSCIQGYFIPYFDYLADRKIGTCGYLAVATSSLVVCKGHILVGKRHDLESTFAGAYELMPSAGLDRHVDSSEELLRHLAAGAGIAQNLVADIRPIALIENSEEGALDICMVIELSDRPNKAITSESYSETLWMPTETFKAHIQNKKVTPTSSALFDYWQAVHVC
jgi:hypothetical protein